MKLKLHRKKTNPFEPKFHYKASHRKTCMYRILSKLSKNRVVKPVKAGRYSINVLNAGMKYIYQCEI